MKAGNQFIESDIVFVNRCNNANIIHFCLIV
jgi:hypothetical protein